MDRLQDSNYRRLIYVGTESFHQEGQIHKFDLNPAEAYITTHF